MTTAQVIWLLQGGAAPCQVLKAEYVDIHQEWAVTLAAVQSQSIARIVFSDYEWAMRWIDVQDKALQQDREEAAKRYREREAGS